MTVFGHTTVESSWDADDGWPNVKGSNVFTLGVNGRVSKITVYLRNNGTGHAACHGKTMIYSTSSGAPDALLVTSPEKDIADNKGEAWVNFTFASTIDLAAGDYALAWIFDSDAHGLSLARLLTNGHHFPNADTYSDGPSDPFGSATEGTKRYSIYATYERIFTTSFAGTLGAIESGFSLAKPHTLSINGTLGSIGAGFSLMTERFLSFACTLGAVQAAAVIDANPDLSFGITLGTLTSDLTIATVALAIRLLDGTVPDISTLDARNKVFCIVKDSSSPIVVGSATNTTIDPTYANSPREMVMFVDSGDATYCGNVATAQLAFVQTEKTRLTGLRVSLRYGLAIERGTLLQVVIPRAGINGNYPVRRLEHDFASGETTIDVGEYAAPRDDPEALIAIAQALAALVKETSI